jgi:hypothetical protein
MTRPMNCPVRGDNRDTAGRPHQRSGRVRRRSAPRFALDEIQLSAREQLATMLDTGTYQLEALARTTRMGVKRLGLAVAEQLV